MAEVMHHSMGSHIFDEPRLGVHDLAGSMARHDVNPTPELPFRFPLSGEYEPADSTQPFSTDTKPALSEHKETLEARRHSRKHKSLALPSFTFNPGASASLEPSQFSTPPQSPQRSSAQSSPSKAGHHRRAHSEFIGGDSRRSPKAARDASPSKNSDASNATAPSFEPETSGRKGHRHRRSGALSSQDLSAVARQTATLALEARKADRSSDAFDARISPGLNTPSLTGALNLVVGASELKPKSSPQLATKAPSPVRVSFADNVEVIPRRSLPTLKTQVQVPALRPTHSSDGSMSQIPTFPSPELSESRRTSGDSAVFYDAVSSRGVADASIDNDMKPERMMFGSADQPLAGTEPDPAIPGVFIVEGDAIGLSPISTFEGGLLSHDFDDDPTSAVISTQQQSCSLPMIATHSTLPESPSDEPMVDLDCANQTSDVLSGQPTAEDLRTLRAKSFSAARHSMHSSGPYAASVNSHRRAESAPSLPAVTFERPVLQRLDSTTASEKGFEMSNVFEEDEEYSGSESGQSDTIDGLNVPATASNGSRGGDLLRPEGLESTSREPTPTPTEPVSSLTQQQRPVFTNTLQFEPTKSMNRPNAPHLTLMESPSPGTRSFSADVKSSPAVPGSSTFSTPRLGTSDTSGSEGYHSALPRFLGSAGFDTRPSSDGVPSLISSRSTITSSAHRYTGSTASPSMSEIPSLREGRPNSQSLHARWRKRSSIASLSLFKPGSSSGKSDPSIEDPQRCQTADGLMETPRLTKKKHRLSRVLKFWKPKDTKDMGD